VIGLDQFDKVIAILTYPDPIMPSSANRAVAVKIDQET